MRKPPFTRPVGRLHLDASSIAECRALAAEIAEPLNELARTHTTKSIERAVLRLIGVDGVSPGADGPIPVPNLVVDAIEQSVGLGRGALVPLLHAVETGCGHIQSEAKAIADGATPVVWPDGVELEIAVTRARAEADLAEQRIRAAAAQRDRLIAEVGEAPKPWFYLIVATGNIHDDIPQAQAAARNGCDIIAVIRSTGQSLLDYVPFGATTEGYAGTYATQENFRLMRSALDEVGAEVGRYIRLTNYASGLCMPEMAALAAMERLDMMLNDCMYGIIFRDINMQRTFIDQHFSRMIHALAGIVINTGEDNYLTTADAVDSAHTVLASHFLNERLGLNAGLKEDQLGLGHAFEINPELPDQVLMEIAHAQLIRECFPNHPLKWMPPTKHMTGNVFQGFLYDGMFNLVGALTGQDIILLGMMTEGIHTPFLSDRDLALENADYVFGAAGGLGSEVAYAPGGFIERRAAEVLEECRQMLTKIADVGMFDAIEAGMFGDTSRARDGGRGLDGVIPRERGYLNSIEDRLGDALGIA
ncbi:MAG TPA: lysine 5,6-aminomutase subunit alpha [Actinomycetota bacterium]|nr:lysine 5,6-aminomutase subunit alpha [Actinomycetota bacterium]